MRLKPNTMESQNKQLKEWFAKGNRVTQPVAMKKMLIGRLASRINDLRKEGVQIKDRFIDYTRADKKVVRIKEYWTEIKS